MRYAQRAVAEDRLAPADRVPWLGPLSADWRLAWPAAEGLENVDPQGTDWYVTVDERVSDVVGVIAAPWPTVDRTGELSFAEPTEAAWLDVGELQATVDRFRRLAGQVERPVRIGDTFWVRGYALDPQSPDAWEALLDVTAAARASAKAAVAAVCVGEIDDPGSLFASDADDADETEPAAQPWRGLPPPAGPGVASPAV